MNPFIFPHAKTMRALSPICKKPRRHQRRSSKRSIYSKPKHRDRGFLNRTLSTPALAPGYEKKSRPRYKGMCALERLYPAKPPKTSKKIHAPRLPAGTKNAVPKACRRSPGAYRPPSPAPARSSPLPSHRACPPHAAGSPAAAAWSSAASRRTGTAPCRRG